MLALTRKKGESLVINNNIEISILEVRGDPGRKQGIGQRGRTRGIEKNALITS